jgi:hypothetical protein
MDGQEYLPNIWDMRRKEEEKRRGDEKSRKKGYSYLLNS